jgi:alkanesulfonate monooxygenase SsuD/methylene tetrahydromethanopterin reductase-like flavin-dependent oxidoreductase (luciferase family)
MRVFTTLPIRDWRQAGPLAAVAEAAGFDALMTVELDHEPFTPLAFAALATTGIELTTSVAVAFPRSPTILASQGWDLNANSNGRFVLGLGTQVKGHNERRVRHSLEPSRAPPARLHRCIAGGVALLGNRRAPRLPGRALPAQPDDPRFLAGTDRPRAAAGDDCRSWEGDATPRR